ncbi:hypothetical protein KAFR_0A04370 [Kazachstania africana CBS 2517]|uniref:Homeobox domain-containing protein n=1 Tax=Kazachstania africana (strain ATCC 22294 / BCRC 22015 / CBS 2517 / CECT 1963 / NBRC 1671 / NRRL Y-8276) TaxID=1071382 RepID=H2ANC2_KAZAF|nr:hypothetical protein KAFR_0A04370 [Kazachstania africana CBS 2517]CCF55872.1 hypothetical protein KAFR_0A04370 [Kazachstania africana CBS 2517]
MSFSNQQVTLPPIRTLFDAIDKDQKSVTNVASVVPTNGATLLASPVRTGSMNANGKSIVHDTNILFSPTRYNNQSLSPPVSPPNLNTYLPKYSNDYSNYYSYMRSGANDDPSIFNSQQPLTSPASSSFSVTSPASHYNSSPTSNKYPPNRNFSGTASATHFIQEPSLKGLKEYVPTSPPHSATIHNNNIHSPRSPLNNLHHHFHHQPQRFTANIINTNSFRNEDAKKFLQRRHSTSIIDSNNENTDFQRSPKANDNTNHNSILKSKKGTGKRSNLPKETVQILNNWLVNHLGNPYPTAIEKNELLKQTGLTKIQLSNWFINVRRRKVFTDYFDSPENKITMEANNQHLKKDDDNFILSNPSTQRKSIMSRRRKLIDRIETNKKSDVSTNNNDYLQKENFDNDNDSIKSN